MKRLLPIILAFTLFANSSVVFAEGLFDTDLPIAPTPSLDTPVYDQDNTTPDLSTNGDTKSVKLTLGSKHAVVNGSEVILETAAISVDGRTFLPLRFITETLLETSPDYNAQTKTITVFKDGKSVILQIGNLNATVDGKTVKLDSAPQIVDGYTLLPLRFFVENFDMSISFDAITKEVGIKKVTEINLPPVAGFEFIQTIYTAGEKIEFVDTSSDPDGHQITRQEFATSHNLALIDTDINKLLAKAPAGEYIVKYRVMDIKGMYSEWIERPLTLLANEAPKIENFQFSVSSIGRGETFDITYDTVNEPWEAISKIDWSFRHSNQTKAQAKNSKPNRIFTSGNYILTLQLTDAYGNQSELLEKEFTITDKIVMTEFEYLASNQLFNVILENYDNTNYLHYFKPLENVQVTDNSDVLLLSDSPENVFDYGVLYQETVRRNGRILMYHVNKIAGTRGNGAGVVMAVENPGTEPVTFNLEKTGIFGPSMDPLEVGTKVLDTHFKKNSPYGTYVIEPGEKAIVLDSRTNINWKTNHLISMLSQYTTTGEIKISIYSVGPTTQIQHLDTLSYLPRDQHPRGSFGVSERIYKIDVPSGEKTSITLGAGESEWVVGKDGITGEIVVNRGNYGVEYKLDITPEEDTLVFLNPRGGPYRGVLGWIDGSTRNINAYYNYDKTYIGKLPAGVTSTIRYMLPNGSSSPVIMGFVPQSEWKK